MVSDCTSPISTTFDPASQIVNAGDAAVFTETISVDATPAQQGQTYECDDWATINGSVMTDAEQPDPRAQDDHRSRYDGSAGDCAETVNPSGKNVPRPVQMPATAGRTPMGSTSCWRRTSSIPIPTCSSSTRGPTGFSEPPMTRSSGRSPAGRRSSTSKPTERRRRSHLDRGQSTGRSRARATSGSWRSMRPATCRITSNATFRLPAEIVGEDRSRPTQFEGRVRNGPAPRPRLAGPLAGASLAPDRPPVGGPTTR